MSSGRFRGSQRRSLRSPFLLAVLAVVLGAVGLTQMNPTPVVRIALLTTDTPTLTATPPNTLTQALTPTLARTASPTSSPTATLTNTPTPTPTVTSHVPATQTPNLPASPTPGTTRTLTGTPVPVLHQQRIPILMYHYIGALPADADAVRIDLTVPADTFDAEMKFLADQGYTTLHLVDLINHLQTGVPLPGKSIVITFDDGYDDQYLNAFPTLKKYAFTGTFFVIGAPTDYGSPGYMRWEQILDMYSSGMEIGNHSLTHRFNLGSVRPITQDTEIKNAHTLFMAHLPNWTPIFSYPSGSYNQYTLDLLQSLGYVAAVTTKQGTVQSSTAPLELRRIRVRGEWSLTQFSYWFSYFNSAAAK